MPRSTGVDRERRRQRSASARRLSPGHVCCHRLVPFDLWLCPPQLIRASVSSRGASANRPGASNPPGCALGPGHNWTEVRESYPRNRLHAPWDGGVGGTGCRSPHAITGAQCSARQVPDLTYSMRTRQPARLRR
jgi:hypothetical protein